MQLGRFLILGLWCGGCAQVDAALHGRPFGVTATRYIVERGDTLGEIAKAHGVTVQDIRSWNGLHGDLIEVDQVLVMWDAEPAGLSAKPGRARPRSEPARPPGGTAEEAPPKRVAIRIDGPAGILGTRGPSGDLSELRTAAEGLTAGGTAGAGSGLDARGSGLAGSGSAETLGEVPARTSSEAAPSQTPGTPRPPSRSRPSAKPCLAGPTDVAGEQGIAVSQGLSEAQIRAGLRPVTTAALSCFSGATGRFEVDLSVRVGCDGRVASVNAVHSNGLPSATVSCVTDTIASAGFDAHAVPDGITFALPLTFEF